MKGIANMDVHLGEGDDETGLGDVFDEEMGIVRNVPLSFKETFAVLDRKAQVYLGLFVLIWFAVILYDRVFTLAYPLFFAPLLVLLYRSSALHVNDAIHSFGTAFLCAPIVMLVTIIVLVLLLPLIQSFKFFVIIFVLLFVQVLGEESFKFFMIRAKVQRLDSESSQEAEVRFSDLRHCLFTSMALSLGYATYQGLMTSALVSTSDNVFTPLLISIVLAFTYIPFHVMTGYLIGLQLGRRVALGEKIHGFIICFWPAIARTVFLYQFFYWGATVRSPFFAWIISAAFISVAFALYVRRVKKVLPADYLESAGYMSIGYIPIVDDTYAQ